MESDVAADIRRPDTEGGSAGATARGVEDASTERPDNGLYMNLQLRRENVCPILGISKVTT